VRDPLQMPNISRRFFLSPYRLAVDNRRILFGPGDHTVRAAVRVICAKREAFISFQFLSKPEKNSPKNKGQNPVITVIITYKKQIKNKKTGILHKML
jgi:hypothetical protein